MLDDSPRTYKREVACNLTLAKVRGITRLFYATYALFQPGGSFSRGNQNVKVKMLLQHVFKIRPSMIRKRPFAAAKSRLAFTLAGVMDHKRAAKGVLVTTSWVGNQRWCEDQRVTPQVGTSLESGVLTFPCRTQTAR